MAAVLLVLAAALVRLGGLEARASNEGSRKFHNHEEGPSLLLVETLKVATTTFTFKMTLLRHYAKQALTPR